MSLPNSIYLGDAVYAYFDGNGIELRLNDHRNQCAVYLEPKVISALIGFWEKQHERLAAEASEALQQAAAKKFW